MESATLFEKELDGLLDRKETLAKDVEAIKAIDKKIKNILKSEDCTSEDIDIKTRDMLLKYYSSECTIHGTYILSTALGIFAFFQVASDIDRIVLLSYPIGSVITTLILSAFLAISILFVVRISYWETLASAVTHARELTFEEAQEKIDPTRDKITFLLRLHRACVRHFVDYHGILNHLVGVGRKNEMRTWYIILFIAITIISWFVKSKLL